MDKPSNVDDYIDSAPAAVQEKLRELRKIIREIAPEATEKISYGIPYYGLNGRLAYFAYFKNHINLTIMLSGVEHFEKDLKDYVFGKGSIQFPNDKPLPMALIKKIIKFRTNEQRSKSK